MKKLAGCLVLAGVAAFLVVAGYRVDPNLLPKVPVPVPVPSPTPTPDPKPKPHKPWRPWREVDGPVGAKVGGTVSPDGTEEIHCDLPGDQHCSNISSRGQGCCVQTSINHSARHQNIPALINFHQWVKEKGLAGGAHPGAVDQRLPKCCKDRGYPVVPYLQVEGSDLEILKLATKTGRMPGVTYCQSPTGRYNGGRIAHMVSLPHASDTWFCVLDNNYIGENRYEWMSPAEFKKTYTGMGGGWAVILLPAGPPPAPTN